MPLQTTSISSRPQASEVMRLFTTGSEYVNQIGLETDEGPECIRAAYGGDYERLVALKNKYDPRPEY